MKYVNLGRSGLKVSQVFFGGSHIGEIIDEQKATALIHTALDHGINTFYTADKYNNGAGQDIIGRILKSRRDDVNIVIKTGYRVGTSEFPVSDAERLASHGEKGTIDHDDMWRHGVSPNSRGQSAKRIISGIEKSLSRLQMDYIDVYSIHYWDVETPIEETLSAMDRLVQAGKVRYIGCSQTAAWQLQKALATSDRLQISRFQCQQIRFNLLERRNRFEQLASAADGGVSILAFSSLAGGILEGHLKRDSELPDSMGFRRFYTRMYQKDRYFDFVEKLRVVANESGREVGELAQAWTLAQAPVASLNIGPNEPEEFAFQVRAVNNPLTPDEAAAIDVLLAELDAEETI